MKTMKFTWLAILITVLASCGEVREMTVLHLNDTHAHISADADELGGYARHYTYVESQRSQSSNLLLLHAGDILTGTVFSTIYKGAVTMELMNRIGYDAMTIGNHEFDYGYERFLELEEMAEFPVLSANVVMDDSGERLVAPYYTRQIDGMNVAVIGMTTSDEGVLNPDALAHVDMLDEIETLDYYLNTVDIDSSNEVIIVISHCGYDRDVEMAKAFPEIDLIVGGHTHKEMTEAERYNRTLVVQAGSDGEYIGTLAMKIKNGKVKSWDYELAAISNTIADNPEIAEYIAEKEQVIEESMGESIVESDYFLDNSELRNEPVALGNFVADILASYGEYGDYQELDVMVLNAGSVRNSLTDGDVTLRDVYELYPFDNELVIAGLPGSALKSIAQKGVDSLGEGAFLYYSDGFLVDATGDELIVTIDAELVEDDEIYNVAVSDFVFHGGDNYTEFEQAIDPVYTGWNLRDLILDYLMELDKIDDSVVDAEPRVLL